VTRRRIALPMCTDIFNRFCLQSRDAKGSSRRLFLGSFARAFVALIAACPFRELSLSSKSRDPVPTRQNTFTQIHVRSGIHQDFIPSDERQTHPSGFDMDARRQRRRAKRKSGVDELHEWWWKRDARLRREMEQETITYDPEQDGLIWIETKDVHDLGLTSSTGFWVDPSTWNAAILHCSLQQSAYTPAIDDEPVNRDEPCVPSPQHSDVAPLQEIRPKIPDAFTDLGEINDEAPLECINTLSAAIDDQTISKRLKADLSVSSARCSNVPPLQKINQNVSAALLKPDSDRIAVSLGHVGPPFGAIDDEPVSDCPVAVALSPRCSHVPPLRDIQPNVPPAMPQLEMDGLECRPVEKDASKLGSECCVGKVLDVLPRRGVFGKANGPSALNRKRRPPPPFTEVCFRKCQDENAPPRRWSAPPAGRQDPLSPDKSHQSEHSELSSLTPRACWLVPAPDAEEDLNGTNVM
jgi:hypothetical protein